jgi:serpin B
MKKLALFAMLAASCVSGQSREFTPEQKALAAAGNDFAFRFLQQIDQNGEGDWFVSPMSLQFLLSVVLNGAQHETADEIARTLGFDPAQLDDINAFSRAMLNQLPKLDPATKLTIGNAVFVNQIYPIEKKYKNLVEKYYDAEVQNLDFTKNDASLRAINGWCNKKTNGLIPSVLEKVDPAMFAYLLNALYFKGSWTYPFGKSSTKERPFHLSSGQEKKVWMMEKERKFMYGENDLCQRVCLPYGSGAYAMYVLLPKEGHTVTEVLASLDAASWKELRSRMDDDDKVNLWLPRFETKYHVQLKDILIDMGMPRSFAPGADFKAMSFNADYLAFVQQDAIIKVDEEGSEAAAVTTAGMLGATAVPTPPRVIDFHADHPFLYLIVERSTGAILFAGQYTGE